MQPAVLWCCPPLNGGKYPVQNVRQVQRGAAMRRATAAATSSSDSVKTPAEKKAGEKERALFLAIPKQANQKIPLCRPKKQAGTPTRNAMRRESLPLVPTPWLPITQIFPSSHPSNRFVFVARAFLALGLPPSPPCIELVLIRDVFAGRSHPLAPWCSSPFLVVLDHARRLGHGQRRGGVLVARVGAVGRVVKCM